MALVFGKCGRTLGSRYKQRYEEIAAIRAALDVGITHIDTAESYGNGHAEELLKRQLRITTAQN